MQDGYALKRAQLPDGAALHFIEMGHGHPVLLLHGGMGDCRSWAPQIRAFAGSFHVIAYSRRHSSPNRNLGREADHSIDLERNDLTEFVRLQRCGPAHLVGTSYGALVALAFALQRPEQVRSLVLAEPPLHRWACRTPVGARLYAEFMAGTWCPAAEDFTRGDDLRALQRLTDGIWGRSIFASLSAERRGVMLRNAGSMKVLTQSIDAFPDLPRPSVAALRIPTLLIQGELASEIHGCVIEELAMLMPHATRAVISNAGHGSPFENPHVFNDAVLGFLEEQDRMSRDGPPHR